MIETLKEPWQRRLHKANPQCNPLMLELIAFRFGTPEHGRFYHMRRLANLFFSKEGNPDIIKPLDWNPWTTLICRTLCDGAPGMSFKGYPHHVGITGPASSSKTYSAALYLWLLWFSNPMRTKGIVASTSIQSAKNRIWADVLHFARSMPQQYQVYKILASNPAKVCLPKDEDRNSIELIAGDDAQMEASDKVIGIKNDWVIEVVDESTAVSHAMLEARHNLSKNPRFQLIFLGNAETHEDPHGKCCEPAKGWDTITVDTPMWETVLPRGLCIHLDGEKSPNLQVPEGELPPYPRLFGHKDLADVVKSDGGTNSPGYQRFTRGFWPKVGSINQIYSQQDIDLNGGQNKPVWKDKPRRCIGHDPSFSTDGDRAKAVVVDIGQDWKGKHILAHVATEDVEVDDSQKQRHSYALAESLLAIAEKYGVEIEDIAVDNTGTGVSYPEIVDEVFLKRARETDPTAKLRHCHRVSFNGFVSDRPYPVDPLTNDTKKMFDRRVSELWYIGKLFLNQGQLLGMKDSLVTSICSRRYTRTGERQICVERKKDMRTRGIRSPDEGDAYFIVLDMARERLGFEVFQGLVEKPPVKKSFKEWSRHYTPLNGPKLLIGRGGWMGKTLK